MKTGKQLTLVLAVVLLSCFAPASTANSGPSANELLRAVVQNELQPDTSLWKYREESKASGKVLEKEVIETKDGALDALLAIDGSPLTPKQAEKQEQEIERIVRSPGLQRRRKHDQEQDAAKADHMLKMLPEAVLATYGERKGDLQELDFKPNPKFRPSTHEDQVFHAMEGKIWVEMKEKRLAEIQGHLVRAVKFGGGLLGHLDKGGEFQVKQSEVGPGHWKLSRLLVAMNGKALFFKTIAVHQDELHSNFRLVPDNLTLTQAAVELRRSIHTAGDHSQDLAKPPKQKKESVGGIRD